MILINLQETFVHNIRLIYLTFVFCAFMHIFWLQSPIATLYLLITLLFIISQNRTNPRKTKSDEVDELRKSWIYHLIKIKLKNLNLYSHKLSYEISKLLNLPVDYFYYLELSNINDNNPIGELTIPDLLAAEKEILDQEIRSSKSLVAIVFVPILFYFIHITYPLSGFYLILNSINIILLIENFSFQLRHPHILQGWNELNFRLGEIGVVAYHDPYHFMFQLRDYFTDIYLLEISQIPTINHNLSSHQSLSQIIQVILNTDQSIRKHVVTEFISATKHVAQLELVHKKKWQSFRIQFIYVTSSLLLFLGILTSIFGVFIRLSNSLTENSEIKIITFNELPFLSEITIIITLVLIYFLSQVYLNPIDQRKFLFLWGLEYVLINQLLRLFFYFIFG